jgi:hypothetical protein
MSEDVKPSVNKRQLNVLIMLFSFVMLPFSGIIIHSTHGMDERELIRHLAMSVHNLSAIIFLSSCVIHLITNRKTLMKYAANKTSEYIHLKREVFIALVFVFGVVGLFAMHAFHVR